MPAWSAVLDAVAAELVQIDEWSAPRASKVIRALEELMMSDELPSADAEAAGALMQALGAADSGDRALADTAAFVERLRASASGQPVQQPSASSTVDRDEETLSLLGQFFDEARDGLEQADQTLMAVSEGDETPEHVHRLFRVFHSIKGVAACVDVHEMARLAHCAESLLDRVRDGALRLHGGTLDLVFEATAELLTLLRQTRAAVEARHAFPTAPETVETLIVRLNAALEAPGAAPAPAAPAPTAPTPTAPAPSAPAPTASAPPAPAPSAPTPPEPAPAPAPSAPVAQPSPPMRNVVSLQPPTVEAKDDDGGDGDEAKRAAAIKLRETLKVDVERVESVVEMIGELIIAESMVANLPEIVALESPRVRSHLAQLTKISRDLQSVSMRLRMVPVRGVFQKMARLVRDLSKQTGKPAALITTGDGTEMDRGMVDRLEEPLLHMVRNAMDHGIEAPDERARAGKPAVATLELSASYEGGNVVVRLADDGRGLDRGAILAKARARGLVEPSTQLTDTEICELIYAPGFSTAAQVTALSGRGVGMDVVKRSIEALRGHVVTQSEHGHGTTFRLVLPLTLAVIDGMLVSCGKERYVLPSLAVVESLRPRADMLRSMAHKDEYLLLRGELLPLLRADSLFSLGGPRQDPTQALVVILESMGRRVGLLVDDVLAQQQFVIKPLQAGYTDAEWFSGAAILSDGRVGLIVNVDRLGQLASRKSTRRADAPRIEENHAQAA